MSQKRQKQSVDDDGAGPGAATSCSYDERRKRPSFKSVVQEVMNVCRVQSFLEPVLEPLIRKVVKEEVEVAFKKYLNSKKRNGGKDIQQFETRNLQLQFQSMIFLPVFTGSRIEGEDGNNLKVALIDSFTGQVICSGAGCSAKVELVVLEGDFDGDEGNDWTVEEFKNNIVKEREGKKPIISGDVFFTLNEGIGVVPDICLTDNSSWTRSRKFRLGARVVENFNVIRVKEAKTESFIVRDHRGELYKKHHPPSLSDEVWRLEKIGKDGAFHKRLSRERVYTVKDFLNLYYLDPMRLRNILGTGMSAKMWEVAVDHARTCVLDNKVYVYPSASQQKIRVVFNIVGQVLGLLSDGRYIASDKMSETENDEARNLVITALRHPEEVISFDDESSFLDLSRSSTTQHMPDLSSGLSDSDVCKSLTSQKFVRPENAQLSTLSPDAMSYSICLDEYNLQSMDTMDVRYDQHLNFPNTFSCNMDFMNEVLFDPFSLPSSSLESAADLSAYSNYTSHTTAVQVHKAHRRWKMLFSVVRWVLNKKNRRTQVSTGRLLVGTV